MTCPLQDQTAQWLLGELDDDVMALHVAGCPACTSLADAYVAVLSVACPGCAEEPRTLAWLYGAEDDAVSGHAATCSACARLVREHSDLLAAVAPVMPALRTPRPTLVAATARSTRYWPRGFALAAAAGLALGLSYAWTQQAPPEPTAAVTPDGPWTAAPDPIAATRASPTGPAPAAAATKQGDVLWTAAAPSDAGAPAAPSPPTTTARRRPRPTPATVARPTARTLSVAVLSDEVDLDRRLDALAADLAAFASDPSLL